MYELFCSECGNSLGFVDKYTDFIAFCDANCMDDYAYRRSVTINEG
jgi:hypothetical protein